MGFGFRSAFRRSSGRPTFKRRRMGGFRRFSFRKTLRRVSKQLATFRSASLQWATPVSIVGGSSGTMLSVHNNAASSTSNGYVHLSGITVGTGPSVRTGNRAQLLRLTVRGITYMSTFSTAGQINTGRIVFYMVKSNGGDVLGTGNNDIVNAINGWSTGTFSGVYGTWNPAVVPTRIRIIKDIHINPFNTPRETGGGNVMGQIVKWEFSVNLRKYMGKDKYSTWIGSSNAASDSDANQVFAAFIQTTPTPADPAALSSVWGFKLSFLP